MNYIYTLAYPQARKGKLLNQFSKMEARTEAMTATRIDMVDGTPFNVATFTTTTEEAEHTTCRIAIGNMIATAKEFKTYEDAVEYINAKPWELLINTFSMIADKYVEKN